MKISKFTCKVIYVFVALLIIWGCDSKIEEDPCIKTKWPQTKEFEIKLAVHVSTSNPILPGGSSGSQKPSDFKKMMVSGTIEKIECEEQTTGSVNIGSSYVTRGVDLPAPIDVLEAYWIGHVVYVYELGNDKDHINVNLTVKITMDDNQTYMCIISDEAYNQHIVHVPSDQEPTEMYYYILIDIYSEDWVKV